MKKLFTTLLILGIMMPSVAVAEGVKDIRAKMTMEYSIGSEAPIIIQFYPIRKLDFGDNLVIKSKSVVTAEVIRAQKERRWHKSAFIICKLLSYTEPDGTQEIDISQSDIYVIARKHELLNSKEATITGTEVTTTTIASFFAPGVDVVYFFTKGAIQREKHPNWFKAGVSNAYDNSICWFWLKGKPIDLLSDEEIMLNSISKEDVDKLVVKIDKRLAKQEVKDQRKAEKQERKLQKEATKLEARAQKEAAKQERKLKKEAEKQEKRLEVQPEEI